MEDFWWKVVSVIWWGGIILVAGWGLLDFFIPEQEPVKKEATQEYTPYKTPVSSDKGISIDPSYGDNQIEKDRALRDEEVEGYVCDCSLTCDYINTCSEAQYQLDVCGCFQRDADEDGIACDLMCQ